MAPTNNNIAPVTGTDDVTTEVQEVIEIPANIPHGVVEAEVVPADTVTIPAGEPQVATQSTQGPLETMAAPKSNQTFAGTLTATMSGGTPKGRILGPNDPETFDGDVHGNIVVLTEDVYRMTFPVGSRRPTYVLVARKGTTVPRSKVTPLGGD